MNEYWKILYLADDVEVKRCCCPKCRKHCVSDQVLLRMHAILKGIRRREASIKLSYLAYFGTMEIPHIQPEDGIFLEFASFKSDLFRKLNDSASSEKQT